MKKQKVSSDPETLTSFGEPKEENSSTASNFFKYVIDLFSPKRDSKNDFQSSDTQTDGVRRRPSVLDLNQPGASSRKISGDRAKGHAQPGSEVELRLHSFSTFLKEFPKLVKGPQSPDSAESEQSSESPTLSAIELRQYWMPDEQCHECYECGEKFTTFRRRHHCRICGQIFCSRCCNQLISGKIMGHHGMLRSCMYCCKLVLRFAEGNKPDVANIVGQTPAVTDETPQDDSNLDNSVVDGIGVFPNSNSSFGVDQIFSSLGIRRGSQMPMTQRSENTFDDKLFDPKLVTPMGILSPMHDQHGWQSPGFIFEAAPTDMVSPAIFSSEATGDLVKDSSQLHSLWRKICDEKEGLEFRDHRLRLRKYLNCITGQELVDWLINNDVACDRAQGCGIGQALCEGAWIKPVVDIGGIFQDGYVLYQNGGRVLKQQHINRIEIFPDHFAVTDSPCSSNLDNLLEREPVWVQEIKCSGDNNDDNPDGYFSDSSESDVTWSDAQSNLQSELLLYSDEEQSNSEKSAVSLSSYVEINEGEEVIKYTKASSLDNLQTSQQHRSSQVVHPDFDDSCLTSISADYLRNFLTWNGNCLNQSCSLPSAGWRDSDLQSKAVESSDKRAFRWLGDLYFLHNMAFLRQLLCEKELDLGWAETLVRLAKHASMLINPDPNVDMDICHYLQIKKVPDGPRFESRILDGVAFTKNVVHKQMRTDIANPAILLLAIPLEYERVQLRLCALDPVVRQEREFYKHLITRVTSRRPDIVVVQCTVSRISQELLLQAGITLIANVKPSVMERLARSTEADVVYSIDQLLQAKLGKCSQFYMKRHIFTDKESEGSLIVNDTSKTLLYFDGCKPIYGCTVILRERYADTSEYRKALAELTKVKDVLRFLVRAMFHFRLEVSYLIDQHNFGKLLKKHSSSKRVRADSESATKCTEREIKTGSFSFKPTCNSEEGMQHTLPNKVQQSTPTVEISENISREPDGGILQLRDDSSQSSSSLNDISNEISFESALKCVLLSISPLIQPTVPYLHTRKGKVSHLRKYLPNIIFQSHRFNADGVVYKKQFSSRVDPDHTLIVRTTPGENLNQDKPWLSTLQQADKSTESMDCDKNPSSNEVSNTVHHGKEVLGDLHSELTLLHKENQRQPLSCYSQQYKQQRPDELQNISDGLSTSSQSDVSQGLYSWEQKMVDMIFGPPTSTNPDVNEMTGLSHSCTPAFGPRESFKQKGTGNLPEKSECDKNPGDKLDAYEAKDNSLHEFITCAFTQPVTSEEIGDLLSSYRAHAGLFRQQLDCSDHNSVQESEEAFHDSHEFGEGSSANLIKKYPAIDCLDPYNHQHICVLFSIYRTQSSTAPQFCVLPWVVNIDFYRGNDITLGGFLERYCFRPSYHCPSATCKMPMVEHVRTFVHGGMCVSVLLKELSKPYQRSGILTWTWDHVTKKSSAIKTLSHDAWFMSFAKYLELNLGQLTIPETESPPFQQRGFLKQDIFDENWELKPFTGFQYFLFRDIVAAFKCFPVALHEVVFPSSILSAVADDLNSTNTGKLLDRSYEDLVTVHDAFYAIKMLEEKVFESTETIIDCINSSRNRKSASELASEEASLSRDRYYWELLSSMNGERSHLLEKTDYITWLLKNSGFYGTENMDTVEEASKANENDVTDEPLLPENLKKEISVFVLHLKCDISKMVKTWNEKLAEANDKDRNYFRNPAKAKQSTSPRSQRKKFNYVTPVKEEEASNSKGSIDLEESTIGLSGPVLSRLTSVNERQDLGSVGSSDAELTEDNADIRSSNKLKRGHLGDPAVTSKPTSHKKMSRTGSGMISLVTKLLPGNTLVPSSPMPFPADEHYLLAECSSTNIVVRDAEPTSIIAYTLSSKEYKEALDGLSGSPPTKLINVENVDSTTASELTIPTTERPMMPEVAFFDNSTSIYANANTKPDAVDSPTSSLSDRPTTHLEIEFSDITTRFYCKAYFASLFKTFRSKVLAGGEEHYITSLSRSMKWLARGGKSGSTFHKTRDDQFILKEMSFFERQSFLEFAPKYVEHMTNCFENNEVTAISKILGVYRISFRNSDTGRSLKQDVLVIENLFHGKKIDRIFDLKGSVRNRHVKETVSTNTKDSDSGNKEDVVLLDENLLKTMCENPIYVREHTKHLLMSAILRDTEFLSKNLIMDYSLLVGIDGSRKIIVGIIDYIRTFTWDKKLEMVVKWSSSRSMPTVVSPELYKNRFCEAMDRYFQVVPDRWYGMHNFDSPPNAA